MSAENGGLCADCAKAVVTLVEQIEQRHEEIVGAAKSALDMPQTQQESHAMHGLMVLQMQDALALAQTIRELLISEGTGGQSRHHASWGARN